MDWGVGSMSAPPPTQIEQPPQAVVQGAELHSRATLRGQETNPRRLSAAGSDGAGDGRDKTGGQSVCFKPVFPGVFQCGRQFEMLSPIIWMVFGAFAQP